MAKAVSMFVKEIQPGDRLELAEGTLYVEGEIYESNISPGLLVLETEVGSLYLDPESERMVIRE